MHRPSFYPLGTLPALDPSGGFTLVELSIVLVIIGLIIGGVLTGQALIEAATVRAQISQVESYRKAAQTFKLKYNCLPGDCANPDALGLYDSATGLGAEGNQGHVADGKITQYFWGTQFYSNELTNFWFHLYRAGLIADYKPPNPYTIPGSGALSPNLLFSTMPASKLNKKIIVIASELDGRGAGGVEASGYDGKGGNGFLLASPTATVMGGDMAEGSADFFPDNSVPVQIAKAIDTKVDDGSPYSGNVVAGATYLSIDACTINCYIPDCTTYGQNTYNLPVAANTLGRCNVAFLRQF